MEHILIFAGTTEGRRLAEAICEKNDPTAVTVCTATEYGKTCVNESVKGKNLEVLAGRMDVREMADLMREKQSAIVIDATHPFARDVTKNIKAAAEEVGTGYLRLLREKSENGEDVILADSLEEAVLYLKGTKGKILITTGSKELEQYTTIPDYRERCYARVLSTEESVVKAIRLGFEGKHLLAMQGPFSKEMNLAVLRQTGASYFVTKESGTEGGYREKLEAANEAGATLVVVRRPEETGYSQAEILSCLERRYEC